MVRKTNGGFALVIRPEVARTGRPDLAAHMAAAKASTASGAIEATLTATLEVVLASKGSAALGFEGRTVAGPATGALNGLLAAHATTTNAQKGSPRGEGSLDEHLRAVPADISAAITETAAPADTGDAADSAAKPAAVASAAEGGGSATPVAAGATGALNDDMALQLPGVPDAAPEQAHSEAKPAGGVGAAAGNGSDGVEVRFVAVSMAAACIACNFSCHSVLVATIHYHHLLAQSQQ